VAVLHSATVDILAASSEVRKGTRGRAVLAES